MSTSIPSLVERIRGAVLQGHPDRELLHRLADAHAREVGKANAMLSRCHRWVQRGCASEAVSLAEGSGLIPAAAALRLEGVAEAWAGLLRAAGHAPPGEVDVALLEALVAAAGRQQTLAPQLAVMRQAFLRRAPLPERLRALHELADRDPRQPAWLEGVRRVEREAVSLLAEAAREAEREQDAALACEIVERLDSMQLRSDEHAELFERVRGIARAVHDEAARQLAAACADRMHAAAAAMDLDALEAAAHEWQSIVAEHDPGDALRALVAGPLDLHHRETERRQTLARRREALGRLELALDEARDLGELERLAEAVERLDAEWPAALRARLQDRRDQHAAALTRRRMVRGVAVASVLAVLAVGGWFGFRAWWTEHRLDQAIAEADRLVATGELDSAAGVLDTVGAEAVFEKRAELAGARLRLANARDRAREASVATDALIDRLDRLGKGGQDPVEMESVARETEALVDAQPAARRDDVRAAIARLKASAGAARSRGLDAARGALHELTARLEGVVDPQRVAGGKFDRTAWFASAEAYEAVARDARAAAATAAAQRDAQAVAESLQGLAADAAQRASKARDRSDRIEAVRATLKKIEASTQEQETLELWESLLREAGDVLADRGLLRSSERARDAARSAVAIRAWRMSVLPELLSSRGDVQRGLEGLDWGDAGTARGLEAALTRHLDAHPDTPYREVAEQVRALSRRTVAATGADTSIGGAARAAIAATGYAGLYEQAFEGGRTLYRRNTVQPATPWGQAIESRRDLQVAPEALATRRVPSFKPMSTPRPWPGSAAVERALADLQASDGRTARDVVLRMLAEFRSAPTSDPLLSWQATRDLWKIWLQLFADESDPEDAAAARWVRSLDGVTALLGEDPILLGAAGKGARSDDLRRQSLDQLSRSFDATRLVAAARRRDAAIAEAVRPVAPWQVLTPAADGALRVTPDATVRRVAVPCKVGDVWQLRWARLEGGTLAWEGAPPEPPITWMQVLFIPGGKS